MASISHPYFKLRWIPPSHLQAFKKAFLDEALTFGGEITTSHTPSTSAFFKFPSETETQAAEVDKVNSVQLECLQYFQNPDVSLSMLQRYPIVKTMFRKYNAALPTSAPVERMFSYGGIVVTKRRHSLDDESVETLVVLKYNHVSL